MARRAAAHMSVSSRRAPRAEGHAAQGVVAGGSLFVGAQLPIEMPAGKVSQAPLARQAGLALGHLRAVVEDAGFRLDEVVSVSLFLVDVAQLEAVDAVYRTFFLAQGAPARTVVEVAALPRGAKLAVACQAQHVSAPGGPADGEAEAPDEDFY